MVRSTMETVTVSKLNSDLTAALERSSGPPGDVDILGTLWEAGQLVVIRNATVELYINGSYKGSVTTDNYGRYTFTYGFPEGSFDIYTSWDGDDTYWSDVSPLVKGTYAKIPAAISISKSPSEGAPPLAVTISGYVSVAATGTKLGSKSVHLYRDGVEIGDMLTNASGYYEFTDVIDKTSSYQTEFKGDDTYLGCEEDESSLACTLCGSLIPLSAVGSDVVCPACGSVFEVSMAG